MKKLLPLLFSLLLLAALTLAGQAQTLEASEVDAAQLINAERVRLGLNPLRISQRLTVVADWMATDMSTRSYVPLDHVDSLGRNSTTRLNQLGYDYNTAKGEILAGNYTTAAAVVAAWIASPSHYAAIQNPKYRVLGVSRIGNYWAVEFGGYADSAMTADIGPVDYATAVNAASYGDGGAPGMLASLFGTFLGGSSTTEALTSLPLPTTLLSIEVRVDGQQAGLIFVSNNQINFQIPATVGTGVKMVDVYRNGTLVSRGNLTIAASFGALFTANASGTGAPAGQYTDDGAIYNLLFDASRNPVTFKPGPDTKPTYLVLYGTGLSAIGAQNLQVYVYEDVTQTYYPCEIAYLGPQGQFVGLDQLNIKLLGVLGTIPGPKKLVMMVNNIPFGNVTNLMTN